MEFRKWLEVRLSPESQYRPQGGLNYRLGMTLGGFNEGLNNFIEQNRGNILNVIRPKVEQIVRDNVPKILQYENGSWAQEISKQDFYHGHICISNTANITGDFQKDIQTVSNNLIIIYHTKELKNDTTKRNIIFRRGHLEFNPHQGPPLTPRDLNSIQINQIYFSGEPNSLVFTYSDLQLYSRY